MTIAKKHYKKAHEEMLKAQRIMIVAHQKPDGDTSGSALSLWHWLIEQEKEVVIFCRNDLAEQLTFMPNADVFETDPELFKQSWDLIIVCDSGDLSYAGVAEHMEHLPSQPKIINIDHHASNIGFGDVNLVDDEASSTAEVIFEFFRTNEIKLSPSIAKCLLTAVFTDTGGFSNPATNTRSLQMAAAFLKQGASIPEVHRATMQNREIPILKVWGKVFSRLRKSKMGIVYTYLLEKDLLESGISVDDVEGLSNYLSHVQDAKAIMVFHERPGGLIKASMRTYRDDVDLSKFAKTFGGGGHKQAAGFTIPGRIIETEDGVRIS